MDKMRDYQTKITAIAIKLNRLLLLLNFFIMLVLVIIQAYISKRLEVTLLILNLIISIVFLIIFLIYWIKIESKGFENELDSEYADHFAINSYIFTKSKKKELEESLFKKDLEKRLFKSKRKFIIHCFFLALSFVICYILLLYGDSIIDNKTIEKKLMDVIPLSTTRIDISYQGSDYFPDSKTIYLHLQPDLLNYSEGGVTYSLTDYALKKTKCDTVKWDRYLTFKPKFIKNTQNIFIQELNRKGIDIENISIHTLSKDSIEKIENVDMVNIKDIYYSKEIKKSNCISVIATHLTNVCLLLFVVFLSYDTHSFKSKLKIPWNYTALIVLAVQVSFISICLSLALFENAYIVGNFYVKSFSAFISVIAIASLTARLNNRYLYDIFTNKKNFSIIHKIKIKLLFIIIYFWAALQIVEPFITPIVKIQYDLHPFLYGTSFLGKISLFLILCIYMKSNIIETFLIYEINSIKHIEKHQGLKDFYKFVNIKIEEKDKDKTFNFDIESHKIKVQIENKKSDE